MASRSRAEQSSSAPHSAAAAYRRYQSPLGHRDRSTPPRRCRRAPGRCDRGCRRGWLRFPRGTGLLIPAFAERSPVPNHLEIHEARLDRCRPHSQNDGANKKSALHRGTPERRMIVRLWSTCARVRNLGARRREGRARPLARRRRQASPFQAATLPVRFAPVSVARRYPAVDDD